VTYASSCLDVNLLLEHRGFIHRKRKRYLTQYNIANLIHAETLWRPLLLTDHSIILQLKMNSSLSDLALSSTLTQLIISLLNIKLLTLI